MPRGNLKLVKHKELSDPRDDQLRALQTISSALQSTFDLPQLLELIVDCAKHLTETEKAILQLVDEKSKKCKLDSSTVVVRGSRSQHPEGWWRKQLENVASKVVKDQKPVMISPGTEAQDKASSMICVPLKVRSRSIGILSALSSYPSSFTHQDITLLTILAGQAAIAVENVKLFTKNQQLAIADERRRIANELHDGIAQAIYNIGLSLQVCQRSVPAENKGVLSRLKRSQQLSRRALEEVRQCVYNLRPSGLDQKELATACKQYLKSIMRTCNICLSFEVSGNKRKLPLITEKTIYRLVQEGVMNIIKHSEATRAEIKLRYYKKKLALAIKDNGKGFDVGTTLAQAKRKGKLGLRSMKQRVEELNGEFSLTSQIDSGTKLKAEVPI